MSTRKVRIKREHDRFTGLPNFVLNHEAVRFLTPVAFKVLVYLAKRCYGRKHNGKVVFSARSGCLILNLATRRYAENSIGISKSHLARALGELQQHGLIVRTKKSTFDQKRVACEWRLTWLGTEEEPSPTREFMSFKADRRESKSQSRQRDYNGACSPTHGTSRSFK